MKRINPVMLLYFFFKFIDINLGTLINIINLYFLTFALLFNSFLIVVIWF